MSITSISGKNRNMRAINQTKLIPLEKQREYYIERSALFGLIKFEETQRVESIGKQLDIFCDYIPEKVFLNGVEYIPIKK